MVGWWGRGWRDRCRRGGLAGHWGAQIGGTLPPPLRGGRFRGVGVKETHNGRGVHENTEVTVVDNVVDFVDLKRSYGACLLAYRQYYRWGLPSIRPRGTREYCLGPRKVSACADAQKEVEEEVGETFVVTRPKTSCRAVK